MKRKILMITAFCFLISVLTIGTPESEAEAVKTKIETVRTDTFSMDYFRFGHGGKTLVILPGLSVESVMKYADAVADAYSILTDDFTIYLFDRRKELFKEGYTVFDMARDTAASIRSLGLDRVCLFGASQGGMIAMAMAIDEPEFISKLVFGSTAAAMKTEQYHSIGKWVRLAEEGDAEGLYLAFGEAIYPLKVFEQSREVLAQSAKGVTEEELARFVILAEAMKDFDVTEQLTKISCPVLVLGSADDQVLGAEASEQIAEKLKGRPDCEVYMYDGYGHAAYDLAPDYKERMLRFLLREWPPFDSGASQNAGSHRP